MATEKSTIYRNAMESLVAEELERQFQLVPPKLVRYLSREEVTAFALNRLPPLYATSERGWRQQCLRGRRDYAAQISNAVRQGLLAVQKDPLRMEIPLSMKETQESQLALQELKEFLKCEGLNWQNLVVTIEDYLLKTARGEISWEKQRKPGEKGLPWHQAYYRY